MLLSKLQKKILAIIVRQDMWFKSVRLKCYIYHQSLLAALYNIWVLCKFKNFIFKILPHFHSVLGNIKDLQQPVDSCKKFNTLLCNFSENNAQSI